MRIHAFTVIGQLDPDVTLFPPGGKPDIAFFAFALLDPFLGGLYAVIYGVTDKMDQRVIDLINDHPVQFNIRAFYLKIDLFVFQFRQVPDHARIAVKNMRYRDHPGLQHFFLQAGGGAIQLGQTFVKLVDLIISANLKEPGLVYY